MADPSRKNDYIALLADSTPKALGLETQRTRLMNHHSGHVIHHRSGSLRRRRSRRPLCPMFDRYAHPPTCHSWPQINWGRGPPMRGRAPRAGASARGTRPGIERQAEPAPELRARQQAREIPRRHRWSRRCASRQARLAAAAISGVADDAPKMATGYRRLAATRAAMWDSMSTAAAPGRAQQRCARACDGWSLPATSHILHPHRLRQRHACAGWPPHPLQRSDVHHARSPATTTPSQARAQAPAARGHRGRRRRHGIPHRRPVAATAVSRLPFCASSATPLIAACRQPRLSGMRTDGTSDAARYFRALAARPVSSRAAPLGVDARFAFREGGLGPHLATSSPQLICPGWCRSSGMCISVEHRQRGRPASRRRKEPLPV